MNQTEETLKNDPLEKQADAQHSVTLAEQTPSLKDEENVDAKTLARFDQWYQTWLNRHKKGVEAIIEEASILRKAKDDLKNQWQAFVKSERLPYSLRATQMRMAIADNPVIADAQNSARLPVAWNVLYHLSKLEPSELAKLLESGDVSVNTSLKQARALLPTTTTRRPHAQTGRKFVVRLQRLQVQLRSVAPAFAPEIKEELLIALKSSIDVITPNAEEA
jgi:hypothetical protein